MAEKTNKSATAEKQSAQAATKGTKTAAKKAAGPDDGILTYNGKPLVRCGNTIYYGDPKDKYVAVFRLEDNEDFEDLQISKKVIVELKTNEGKRSTLIRQAERDGLYKALDVGMYWLEQALENG